MSLAKYLSSKFVRHPSPRWFFQSAALVLIGLGTAIINPAWVSAAESPTARKPNIVLIMADDLGIEALGCYGADAPFDTATPNCDRLAREGMKFTRMYNHALCSPTRVSLMTGQHVHRNYQGWGKFNLDAGPTFASLLENAGYATAIAGKWQIEHEPAKCGFGEYLLWHHTGAQDKVKRYWGAQRNRNGKPEADEQKYGPDEDVKFLIDFMKQNRDKPFLAYHSMCLVHSPILTTPDAREAMPNLLDNVKYMDKQVGQLIDAVDELGLKDNTLIIFIEDNGTDKNGEKSLKTWRGEKIISPGKHHLTERGALTAGLFRWPGTIAAGSTCDDLTAVYDFLPTFVELAGGALPKNYPGDGISFAPQLRGQPGKPHDWILLDNASDRRVLNRDCKLDSEGNLYDLSLGIIAEQVIVPESTAPEAKAAREKLSAVMKGLPALKKVAGPGGKK